MNKQTSPASSVRPAFTDALRVWARIGLISFGGPAGQIALMHRELVEEKRWIDDARFLSALNFCMLLPGPEAMQLATYVGWQLHGIRGGLAAGLLFILPGAVLMALLALGYAAFGTLPLAEVVFIGIKAAVLAIVVEALIRVARRALKGRTDWAIAAAAFLAIFALGVPFPIIILSAALLGFCRKGSVSGEVPDPPLRVAVTPWDTARTAACWAGLWICPLVMLAVVAGSTHVLVEIAWFFSKLAVVTFGGAYAVLAYMAQAAVEGYGWLDPGEMLDALGLAETTPGPLILVTEFVGALAAWRGGGDAQIGMALLGAAVTLWATFTPCFLWIFTAAPYIERLNAEPRLKSALSAVTAAVVGVILNLSLWFSLHVLFSDVEDRHFGWFRVAIPDYASLRFDAALLAGIAFVLLFGLRCGVVTTLTACGTLAIAGRFLEIL
jgi:chromate transporter